VYDLKGKFTRNFKCEKGLNYNNHCIEESPLAFLAAHRFPEDFMFQLTKEGFANLKSQFATSDNFHENCS